MLYNHLTDEEFIKQVQFELDAKRPGTPYVHLLQEALERLSARNVCYENLYQD